MNKIEVFPKSSLKISRFDKNNKYHMRRGVSDVVAVLILIVIAIIGAVAVGYILTTSSHSVGNQVASQGNGNSAESTLYVGGSTTVFPVTEDAKATFETTYHINIVDAQGGSGGGMQGVIDGALDIGAASSLAAVYSAVTYVAANSLAGINLDAFQVGGSGVAIITSSTENGESIATSNALEPAFLTDASGNACVEISQAALIEMYDLGAFSIAGQSCATGTLSYTTGGAEIIAAAAYVAPTGGVGGNTAPYQAVGRSDNSGTSDTFTGFLGNPSNMNGIYPPGASLGFQGNPGVLSAVQTAKTTSGSTMQAASVNVAGVIGYVDLGFAEGAPAGLSCGTGFVASTPCNVSIIEPSTSQATFDTLNAPSSTAQNAFVNDAALIPCAGADEGGYTYTTGQCTAQVGPGVPGTALAAHGTTAGVHSAILAALKLFSNANPYLNTGYTVSYPDAGAASTGLVKVFYYVTNGTPTPSEQEFINFMLSPNAQPFFNTNGFFAWDQYAAA